MSKHLIAVVLGALVLAATGASFALARDGKPGKRHAPRSAQVEVLRFTDRTVEDTEIDLGAPGFSQGDELVFIDDLFQDSTKVGTLAGSCKFVRVAQPAATLQCTVTASLQRGDIAVQGLIDLASEDDTGPFTLAVTGGTGAYRTAHGEVTVQFVAEDTAHIRFELIR